MMVSIKHQIQQINDAFEQFYQLPFDDDDDLLPSEIEKSQYYQAKSQIVHQIDLLIRELRKTDKTAYPTEIKALIELWADNSGCWIDKIIEDDLLDKLIDDGFLSNDDIMFYNNATCYRQG